LFGDPPDCGGFAASGAGARLTGAGGGVDAARSRVMGLSGELASAFGRFADGAGAALDRVAGADHRLSGQLDRAARSDSSGRSASGSLVDGAAADTAALAPWSGTPAGQRALIRALRWRVAEQQRVVAAYRLRDARIAGLLRSMTYAGSAGVSGGGLRSLSAGGRFGGAPVIARFSGGSADSRPQRVVLTAARRARDTPPGPAAAAVEAALSRRGCPYVWGATGPSTFDCSGLTQWSWAQAGLHLGRDTYHQINEGAPVPADQVRGGDLIFPSSSFGEDGRPGPGHVQLAISPTQVVEAPHAGAVVHVAPMPSSFVARRPVVR
jgi:hypothetical protein